MIIDSHVYDFMIDHQGEVLTLFGILSPGMWNLSIYILLHLLILLNLEEILTHWNSVNEKSWLINPLYDFL